MPAKSRAIFAFIYIIFILVHQIESLSCGKCRPEECEIKECKFGATKDACNCCEICAKGPGEECGGPWGLGGKCAQNFTCTFSKLPEGVNFYFFRTGICLPDNLSPEENMTH